MKKIAVAALLFAAACASSQAGPETAPPPAPNAGASDERVAELQTQLTELLERIDVLNDRIARLEEGGATAATAQEPVARPEPAPAVVTTSEAGPSAAMRRAAPATVPSAAQPQQQALVGAQIAENYRQAIVLVGGGRHAEARRVFQGVYDADPNGDLADNALFWIGETYFNSKDYTNAVRFYNRVVSDYSTQNKAPDAMFKIALAQERTGDLALARRTLQQVIARYPYSSSASSAKAELQRIKY